MNFEEVLMAMSWAEIGSVLFSLAYVVLAAREKSWCWPVGIVGCALWFYSAWFEYKLKIDALLQLYYIVISFYGWFSWNQQSLQTQPIKIHTLPFQTHALIIIAGSLVSLICGYFFAEYTDAVATYLDAFTTVFSVITTAMVTRKILENWVYWVIIDITYVGLYGSRGGYLFATLFVVYTMIAVYGFFVWKKKLTEQT